MSLFSRRKRLDRDEAARLYDKIVAQARNPAFYARLGVPDTAESRFEMVVLHVFAVTHRLVRGSDGDPDLARLLTEAFVADMDGNLREMGVSDISVGKKVKGLFAAYRQRVAGYDAALAETDGSGEPAADAMALAVARNIFRDAGPPGAPVQVAAYVRGMAAGLAALPSADIRRLGFAFPDPVSGRTPEHGPGEDGR